MLTNDSLDEKQNNFYLCVLWPSMLTVEVSQAWQDSADKAEMLQRPVCGCKFFSDFTFWHFLKRTIQKSQIFFFYFNT